MTDFKIKMAELAAKYHISHQRDIDWHNFVAEVEQLTRPEKDCAELIESSRALYFDIGFCITELLRARREGNEQHECNALSRMESLMNDTQQHLDCIIDYLEKQKERKNFRKLYEDIAQSEWFKKNYVGKSLGEEQKPEWSEADDDAGDH